MKKIISTTLAFLLLFSSACSGTQIAAYTANDARYGNLTFDPAQTYEIIVINRPSSIRVKGDRLSVNGDQLNIKGTDGQVAQVITRDRIANIYAIQYNKRGKNTLIGLGIGSGVGLAIGMIPMALFGFKNCDQSTGDPSDCRQFQKVAYVTLPVSVVVLGGAGALVGSLLKAKETEEKK